MPLINDHVRSYTLKDYGGHLSEAPIALDCTLGVNPEELPGLVFQRLAELTSGKEGPVKQYPHDEELLEKIALWYKGLGFPWLKKENLILGCGSYDILCSVNLLCLAKNKKVLGHSPQFSAYVDHVHCIGAEYDSYVLSREKNYAFETEGYLEKMRVGYDLFIVENPNNPTGQEIALPGLEKIAARAASLDRVLIVDEAYGDYLEPENSAIHLVSRYPNVIVTRTFSKGFGMAGIRLGYAVVSAEGDLQEHIRKLQQPFNAGGVARLLAGALMDSLSGERAALEDLLKTNEIKMNKQKVLSSLTKLKAAKTSERVPIMTLYSDTPDKDFDLQRFLAEKAGLGTVSCAAYGGLDAGAVRLMLPGSHLVDDALIPMLAKAQSLLL